MRKELLILFCLFPAFCYSQKSGKTDYLLYSLVIKGNPSFITGSVITIIDSTENFGIKDFVKENEDTTDNMMKQAQWRQAFHATFDSLGYQALVQYYFYPKKSKKLKNTFPIKNKVNLISLTTFRKTPVETGNNQKKPNPIGAEFVFQFSNIYYSKDESRAALQYSIYDSKGKQGFGKEVIFIKENNRWNAQFNRTTWYN